MFEKDLDKYPLPGFHFQVDFLFSMQDKYKYRSFENAGFMEISGIKAGLEFEEKTSKDGKKDGQYRELGNNGNPHKFPSGRKFDNITLKRGMTYSSKLASWFESSLYNLQITPIPILISVLNVGGTKTEKHKPLISWLFYDAYPVSWEYSGFDAMKSQYIIESIELHYSYFILLDTKDMKENNLKNVKTLFSARKTKDIEKL